MLIGLSVSSCIADIASGKVDPEQVAYIIGGINPLWNSQSLEEGLDSICENYNKHYWRDLPNAEQIFREWFAGGRIPCPRMIAEADHKAGDSRVGRTLVVSGRRVWLQCEQVSQVEEYFGEPEWM